MNIFVTLVFLNQILSIYFLELNLPLFHLVHVTLLPSNFRCSLMARKPGTCLLLSALQCRTGFSLPKAPTDQITFLPKPGTSALQLANIWVSTVCKCSSRSWSIASIFFFFQFCLWHFPSNLCAHSVRSTRWVFLTPTCAHSFITTWSACSSLCYVLNSYFSWKVWAMPAPLWRLPWTCSGLLLSPVSKLM